LPKPNFSSGHLQVQLQLRSLLQELNTHRGASQAHLRRPLHGPWPSLQSLRPQTRHKAPGPCANSEKPIPKKVCHPPAVPNRMAFLKRPTSTPSTSSSFKLPKLPSKCSDASPTVPIYVHACMPAVYVLLYMYVTKPAADCHWQS